MAISFDSTDLGQAKTDLDALELRFGSLTWTYNTDNSAEVRFEGSSVAPYTSNGFKVRVSIPVASDGTLTYTQAKFYFIANPNLKMLIPEPDSATRSSMTTITEVGDWLEGFVDSLS